MERPEILLFNINISSPYPLLGIASLAAYLKERGVHVLQHSLPFPQIKTLKHLFPLNEESRFIFQDIEAYLTSEKTHAQLPKEQLNIVNLLTLWSRVIYQENPISLGISVIMTNVFFCLLLCRIVKKSLPGIKIILGGPECNVTTGEYFLREGYADVVVLGEGEIPLFETLCCIRGQRPIEAPGAMTLANTKAVSFSEPPPPPWISTPCLSLILETCLLTAKVPLPYPLVLTGGARFDARFVTKGCFGRPFGK